MRVRVGYDMIFGRDATTADAVEKIATAPAGTTASGTKPAAGDKA
jgi:hypothetical protein